MEKKLSKKQQREIEELELNYLAQAFRELSNIIETSGTRDGDKIAAAKVYLRQNAQGWLNLHKDFRDKIKSAGAAK